MSENIYKDQKESFEDEINNLTKNMFDDKEDVPEMKASDQEPEDQIEQPIEIVEEDPEEIYAQQQVQSPEIIEQHREVQDRKKAAKLQREKFQLAEQKRQIEAEALRLRQENEILRTQHATTSNASIYHHENSLKLQQQSLEDSYQKAIDMNDARLAAQITREMTKVEVELGKVNDWKTQEALAQQQYYQQQQYSQNYYPEQNYQEPDPVNEETIQWAKKNPLAIQWAQKNPWAIPNDPSFDEDKFDEFVRATNYLDSYLSSNGLEHQYATPSYFASIDDHMNKVFASQPRQQSQQQLSMNRSQSPVAPVRRSGSGNYNNNSPNRVTMTPGQKEMAKLIEVAMKGKVKTSDFAYQIMQDNKRKQQAYDQGDFTYLRQHGIQNNGDLQ
jgi:hypothetical protein